MKFIVLIFTVLLVASGVYDSITFLDVRTVTDGSYLSYF